MSRIYDERIEDDWRIGPRDFNGYEGEAADDRNYGYYDPPYWREERARPQRIGDWGNYLARRRAWLQARGYGRDFGNRGYWGGREEWRNTGDFGTQGRWGTHLNWTGGGPHAGRGPKNYQRSDARILEEINERLTDHPDIDASSIEVRVEDGEATLTGTVDSRRTKRLAEDVTESVRGVRDVHNQLHVGENVTAGAETR
jgi:hypothetical protein